jgi:lysophospholipase L1-like esterase
MKDGHMPRIGPLLLVLASLGATSATAANSASASKIYLALGDSLAFGYNPTVAIDLANYHGYPEFVSDDANLQVTNASCVGESSASFLTSGAPDLGCQQWKQANLPMFVRYTETQMEYAIAFLRANPNVKLLTINIGGNDLGLLRQLCGSNLTCQLLGLPGVYAAYSRNLLSIFSRLRQEAGYRGSIVLLTYYAFDYSNLANPETAAFVGLNGVASGIATAFGAKVADGFHAFFEASIPFGGNPCAAGLLVPLPTGGCDVHPSVKGHKVLADAIMKFVKAK